VLPLLCEKMRGVRIRPVEMLGAGAQAVRQVIAPAPAASPLLFPPPIPRRPDPLLVVGVGGEERAGDLRSAETAECPQRERDVIRRVPLGREVAAEISRVFGKRALGVFFLDNPPSLADDRHAGQLS
jgi:hypothetical protein